MMSNRVLTNVLTCAITATLVLSPAVGAVAAPTPEPADVPRKGAAQTAPTPFASALLPSEKPAEISADVTHLALDDNGDVIVTRRDEECVTPGPGLAAGTSRQGGRFGS
jgi:hypothetical protein